MALLMRTQLIVPDNNLIGHQLYNELFTMHGTTMLFLFAVPMVEGVAIYLLPSMLGTRDLAFPRLSAFGYWCFLFGGILLYSSFLFAMVPDAGWTMYTPLSDREFSPGQGVDFWLLGITLVEVGSVTAAAEIAVSILKTRAPGMSLNRMPLFAWYMLVVAFMILFGFPPLILGDALLEIQRSFDWPFFDPTRGGDPLLWQHLFWIFGHPEVYIIFLPAAGFVSTMIATFCQRPTVGYAWLVVSAVGTGFVSFGLWVHHMFATGIPLISMSLFSAASMTVAIFAGIQVFAWLATLWLGKPVLKTPMLFVCGFIFTFVAGGLTGVMLASIPFDWQAHSSYFLVAHFHYVLIGGMVFPLFGAFYYWFPLFSGRMLSERLGQWNFWLLFTGFNVAFFPMHVSGLKGMPRRVYTYPEGTWEWENLISTLGAYLIGLSVLLFIFNVVYSMRKGAAAGRNPWRAGTLEWATPLPTPHYNHRSIAPVDDAYPLWKDPELYTRIERGDFMLADAVRGQRLMPAVHPVSGEFEFVVVQAKPDVRPLAAAIAATLAMVGFLTRMYWLCALAAGGFLVITLWWLWALPQADKGLRDAVERATGFVTGAGTKQAFGWWGTCIGLGAGASITASLFFACFYLWSTSGPWPPYSGTLLQPGLIWISTAALAFSSVSIAIGQRFPSRSMMLGTGLALAVVAALVHLFAQLKLLRDSGLPPREHVYNALIYTISGYQLLHVLIGLAMVGFTLAWLIARKHDHVRGLIAANTAVFWHYMVVVGLATNAALYFWAGLA